MKRKINIFICLVFLTAILFTTAGISNAADLILWGVSLTQQEHSQWCWAGSSKAIVNYYGIGANQCDMANYSFGRGDCCGNTIFDWSSSCNSPNGFEPIRNVLTHYGITNFGYSALPKDYIVTEINAGRPFEMMWNWTNCGRTDCGGHALVGRGYTQDGNYIDYMDPWQNNGFVRAIYDWVVSGGPANGSSSNHVWAGSVTTYLPTGEIGQKWRQLGGAPGAPQGIERPVYNSSGNLIGRVQSFVNGRIFKNNSNGNAYWVHGAILDKYHSLGTTGYQGSYGTGFKTGFLGLPTSDEYGISTDRAASNFQGGSIYWGGGIGAFEVHGEVLNKYLSSVVGGPGGNLGLPISDQYATASGYRSNFENGYIELINGVTTVTFLNSIRWGWKWEGQTSVHVVAQGDYDGDGKTDRAIVNPNTGQWYVIPSSGNPPFDWGWPWGGQTSVHRVAQGDYDGDGKTDRAIVNPNTGQWYVIYSGGKGGPIPWGWKWEGQTSVHVVAPGDYNGDGKTDRAIVNPNTGQWYVIDSK